MVKVETERFSSDFWVGKSLLLQVVGVAESGRRRLPHLRQLHAAQATTGACRPVLCAEARQQRPGRGGIGSGRPGFLIRFGIQISRVIRLSRTSTPVRRLLPNRDDMGATPFDTTGASGKLGITLPTAWRPYIGGQYTWGSGDSNPADGVHGTFDGIYGGRDIFFYRYFEPLLLGQPERRGNRPAGHASPGVGSRFLNSITWRWIVRRTPGIQLASNPIAAIAPARRGRIWARNSTCVSPGRPLPTSNCSPDSGDSSQGASSATRARRRSQTGTAFRRPTPGRRHADAASPVGSPGSPRQCGEELRRKLLEFRPTQP